MSDYFNEYTDEIIPEEEVLRQERIETEKRLKALKKEASKTFSRAGFLTFIASIVFTIGSYALSFIYLFAAPITLPSGEITLPEAIDSLPDNIINAVVALSCLGAVGVLFLLINKTKMSQAVLFEKVKPFTLITVVIAGFSVCMVSNSLTGVLLDTWNNIGIDLSFDIETPVSNSPIEILVYFLGTAIVPAFTEEFAFRGVMLTPLRKYGDARAVLITSILFALMHGNFVQIPFTFIGGLVFGFAVVYTNSLLPAMLIHALNNGFSVVCDLIYTNADTLGITELQADVILNLFIAFIMVISLLLVMIFIKKEKGSVKLNRYEGELPLSTLNKATYLNPGIIIAVIFQIIYSVFQHILIASM